MALKRCRECGKPVSTEANVCPHCGVPNPTLPGIRKASSARSRIGIGVLAVLGVLGLISFFDSGSPSEPPAPAPVAVNTEAGVSSQHDSDVAAMKKQAASELSSQPTAPDCKTDYRVCKDNADLVNNYQGVVKAQGDCKFETGRAVQYGRPDWGGIFDLPFSKYAVGQEAPKTGIVTLIDDHVELQNQFGAMAKAEVVCRYNLRSKVVASLTINGEPVQVHSAQ